MIIRNIKALHHSPIHRKKKDDNQLYFFDHKFHLTKGKERQTIIKGKDTKEYGIQDSKQNYAKNKVLTSF